MYEVISLAHTADIRLKIEAVTLDDLFRAGLVSMGNIMKESAGKKDLSEFQEILR